MSTGETQEECNKCGKVYMAPESDKGGRGTCPECAPPTSIVIMKTDVGGGGGSPSPADDASYGDSEDSRSSSMASVEDKRHNMNALVE